MKGEGLLECPYASDIIFTRCDRVNGKEQLLKVIEQTLPQQSEPGFASLAPSMERRQGAQVIMGERSFLVFLTVISLDNDPLRCCCLEGTDQNFI